ncbi:MAG: hypothetical protein QM802_20420 [Agriterribacter sp.]
MKKIAITIVVFLVCGYAVQAQNTPKKTDSTAHHSMMMKDCVMMKDGKMTVMKGGKTMDMTDDMKLSNGTTIMKDGSIKMKDGKTSTLNNGDCIYMDGKIKRAKAKTA